MSEKKAPPETVSAVSAPVASAAFLKALSHPVRQQIHNSLTRRGHARAADLADELDLPANQISFHLRTLADAGVIEEAPEYARDRRDRVWQMKRGAWSLGDPEHPVEDEALADVVSLWVANDLHLVIDRLQNWAKEFTSGRDPQVHGTLTQSSLWLTQEEFEELTEDLDAVLTKYRARHEPGDQAARRWQLGIIAADDEI